MLAAACFFLLLWLSGVTANSGIVARLNNRRIQLLNPRIHDEWSDYCQYSSSSPRRMFSVFCHSLGYEVLQRYSPLRYMPDSTRNYSLYNLNCDGSENSLAECDIVYNTYSSCRYYYNVYCQNCTTGRVRLSRGLIPQQGYVEVCNNGLWSRPCSSSWDGRDTAVVCRQLRFPITKSSYSTSRGFVVQNSGYKSLNRTYHCSSNEAGLTNCFTSTRSNCFNKNYFSSITVHCKGDPVSRCTPGSIRLHEGKDEYEGELQICINWIWEGVIYRYWDYYDAQVACKQLFLFNSTQNTKITWQPVVHQGLSAFRGMRCTGSEQKLQDCLYSSVYQTSQVYLRCQPAFQKRNSCSNGDVRLVGSSLPNEGRVEICYEEIWGPICRSSWGLNENAIVCGQLGYQTENSIQVSSTKYGDGSHPFLLSNLYCNKESTLLQCQRGYSQIGYHTCSSLQGNAAAVQCDISTCNHGEVRLFGGYGYFEGAPEVCINGKWTYGCYQSWKMSESTYFCKQILQRTNIRAVQSSWSPYYQHPRARMTLSNVICSTSPTTTRFTRDCTYTASNTTCSPVLINCFETGCINGSVRLSHASSQNKGVVEVCLQGVWGSIIYSSWDTTDARVVCRMLAQPWERSLAAFTTKQLPFLLSGARCQYSENSILDCSYSMYFNLSSYNTILNNYRSSYRAAAVVCMGNYYNHICEAGDFRLLNSTRTSNTIEGGVEICSNGQWHGICSWSQFVPRFICKQLLGHSFVASWKNRQGYYGRTNEPLLRLNCYTGALTLSSCYLSSVYCPTTSSSGITCQDILYKVNIVSSRTSHLYELGSTANFSCTLSPNPIGLIQSAELHYSWTMSRRRLLYRSIAGSNISIYLYAGFTSGYIHCNTYVNGGYFKSGKYFMAVKDPIIKNSIEKKNQRFRLVVNITNEALFDDTMKGLEWYYNGYPISSSSNFLFREKNKSLLTSTFDRGVFEVKYQGFLVIPYNKDCDKALLQVLNHYPAFIPAKYYHYQEDLIKEKQLMFISTNKGIGSTVPFTINETIFMIVSVDIPDTNNVYFGSQYLAYIYRNGQYFSSSSFINYSYRKWNRSITIGSYFDAGIYEVILFSQYSQDFRRNCPSYYSLMVSNKFYINEVILEKQYVQLDYYENATVFFNAQKLQFYSTETNKMTCNGTIDFPKFTQISITKLNVSIIASRQNAIQIRANGSNNYHYGVYICIMDATGMEFTKTLFLRNKVNFAVQLSFKSANVTCTDDSEFQEMLIHDLFLILRDLCKCNLTRSDLSNTSMKCKDDSSVRAFIHTTLTYSSDTGDEIARTIAQKLYAETLVSSNGLKIGDNILIETVIFVNDSIQSPQNSPGKSLPTIGVAIGSFTGGAVLAVICLGIIFISYCVRQRKSSSNDLQGPCVLNISERDGKYTTNPSKSVSDKKEMKELSEYANIIQTPNEKVDAVNNVEYVDWDQEQPTYESVEHMDLDVTVSQNLGCGGITTRM